MVSVTAGIRDLIRCDFEAAHQPIQALGEHIPGREIFVYHRRLADRGRQLLTQSETHRVKSGSFPNSISKRILGAGSPACWKTI